MSTSESRDTLLWVVVAVAAVLLLGPMLLMAFAAPMMGGWMMGGPWGGGSGMAPGWALVWTLVPFAVVVGLGYLGYRALQGGVGGDPALEELRLAYARGDVTEEEYERRREQLERDRER